MTVSALTAVDVLLEPDEPMRERAQALNAALRASTPSGFAFDRSHAPHLTLLQRYVRRAQLEQVLARVEETTSGKSVGALSLRAVGLVAGEFGTPPGTVLASITVEPVAGLVELHRSLVRALVPFARSGGTAAAFFADSNEPEINDDTITYVEEFVPAHSGQRYAPHISVGVGDERFVAGLIARPFEVVAFSPRAIGVYRLGNLGTARQALRRWRL